MATRFGLSHQLASIENIKAMNRGQPDPAVQ